ncbi:MAG: fibrobacter succinogenes major paralogous domain-containing protein [Bacteroidia bacterium]
MKKILPVCAILLLIFGCKKDVATTPHVPFVYTDSVADIDGNYYHTITIGSQIWLAENLRTTRFQNGDAIFNHTSSGTWSYVTTPAYVVYKNDSVAGNIYGNLYNYWAVNDSRNICPPGYHVPGYYEWQLLISVLGNSSSDKIREYGSKHWFRPNDNATDEYGFAALPGGFRPDYGEYENVRLNGYFWTASHYIPSSPSFPQAWYVKLSSDLNADQPTIGLDYISYVTGFSVRCIKD